MNEPIVYKTKNCAILSMHFQIDLYGERDLYSGKGGLAQVVGRGLGEAVAESFSESPDSAESVLSSSSVALAEAFNSLIEEGWVPQSTGFGGAGSGRTQPTHGYIFVQIFTKPKKTTKKTTKSK